MKEKTMREIALDTLIQIEKNRAYSNLLLNQVIDKSNLNQKDIHLLTEIVYGVVQHNNTLDFYVEPFLQSSKKTAPWVKMLLKMSIYQMVYLDRVPNHAIFYEAVEIAKKRGHKGIGKLVNGVLRNIERKGLPKIEEIQDEATRLSIQYSHPKWLIKRWIEQYGKEKAIDICRYNLLPPTMSIRINQTKKTRDEVIELLQKEQIEATKSKLSKDGLLIKKGNPTKIKAFKDGYYTVQDESSMLIADALDLFEGASILDACAAPGGKTTHIGERLNGTGQVLAVDLHKHKVKLINEQKERLHLTNIEAIEGDAKRLTEVLKQESFDRILVDAPCSGFGVLRKKPDAKWQKNEKDIMRLPDIQLSILDEVASLLKIDGKLVYSTCTIDKMENEAVVEQFLTQHPEFSVDPTLIERFPGIIQEKMMKKSSIQILPCDFGSDGFFIACFIKTKEKEEV